METTILVMLSGGIDSCYMLYYYLTKTQYNIHAHHISLRYPSEPRWEQEYQACRKIIEYCGRIRRFSYSESRCDIGFKYYVGRDSDTQLLMAAKVAPNLKGKVFVALGWECGDMESEVFRKRMENNITQNLWKALCSSMDYPYGENVSTDLLFPLMDMELNKESIMTLLPKDLVNITWSCRKPSKNKDGVIVPCGKCKPCIARENMAQDITKTHCI